MRQRAPFETFADESFGTVEAFRNKVALAQLPRGGDYSWLHDLRRDSRLVQGQAAKWRHLHPVLVTAPHGDIAQGAKRTLSRALVTVLDLDEYRMELAQGREDLARRAYDDDLILDRVLLSEPTLQAVCTPLSSFVPAETELTQETQTELIIAEARRRLGLPPSLLSLDGEDYAREVIKATILNDRRPERHKSLLVYAVQGSATFADWLDPEAWERACAAHAHRHYMMPGAVKATLMGEALRVQHSVDRGDDPSRVLLNELREDIEERQLRPERLSFDDLDDEVTPVVHVGNVLSDEGQGCDLAAGWAAAIYCEASSHDEGVRRLQDNFRGVIVNGRLYQR